MQNTHNTHTDTDTEKDIPFYYAQEDLPPTDPQTALELYKQSRDWQINPRDAAETLVADIVNRTSSIKRELDDVLSRIDPMQAPELVITFQEIVANSKANFEDTGRIYHLLERYANTDSHALGIIQAQEESIQQLSDNIEDLLTQIESGNTLDDRFLPLVEAVKSMAHNDSMFVARVEAEFQMIDRITHFIRHQTGATPVMAYELATRLFWLMQGQLGTVDASIPMSAEENQAFLNLLEVLVIKS